MMAALDLDAVPLTGTIGAEVGASVQLREMDEALAARVRRLIGQCCVVVFRDQHLGAAEMAALGPKMGRVGYTAGLVKNTEFDTVYRIDNPGKANARTEDWHTDSPYSEHTAGYTMLSAAVIPPAGGDTLFINQYASYEALSEGYKRLLRGLKAEHIGIGQDYGRAKGDWPIAVHPLVRTHPESGQRALYVNIPRVMGKIVGFNEHESRQIIEYLYAQSIAVDRMYRHKWRVGDLVIWDNRCTLHAAAHDYGDATRTLFRIITDAEAPFDAPYVA